MSRDERAPGDRGAVTGGEAERRSQSGRSDGADVERIRDDAEALALLERGTIEVLGLLPRASNFTFLARVRVDQDQCARLQAAPGEAPLWDFEEGTLAAREVAAYVVADALGWPWVPPTVLGEGPQGTGSLQRFVAFDPDQHYLTMRSERADEFRRIALFDLVANNADRKSGHCLLARDGRIFAVDHGVCFHVEAKLRTVIWDFVGEPIRIPSRPGRAPPNLARGRPRPSRDRSRPAASTRSLPRARLLRSAVSGTRSGALPWPVG